MFGNRSSINSGDRLNERDKRVVDHKEVELRGSPRREVRRALPTNSRAFAPLMKGGAEELRGLNVLVPPR